MVVVDLGVNSGAFATGAIRKHGAEVFGVEPVPELYDRLKNIPGLTVDPVAVTNTTGEAILFLSKQRCASVEPSLAEHDSSSITVPTTTLADLVERHSLKEIDVLKVDIEGAEIDVLPQINTELASRISQITVEFHAFVDPLLSGAVQEITRHLEGLGFRRVDMSRNQTDVLFINGRRVPLSRLQSMYLFLCMRNLRGLLRMLRRGVG